MACDSDLNHDRRPRLDLRMIYCQSYNEPLLSSQTLSPDLLGGQTEAQGVLPTVPITEVCLDSMVCLPLREGVC